MVRNVCGRLKDFLSYAAQRHWCERRLGLSIVAPRIYPQEGLPYHAPWPKIVAMLRAAARDRSCTGRRTYAILMLLDYLLLLLISLIGTYIPTRRAARVLPCEALRDE